ncbi:MAG: Smr/MutS family protein [Alphaproteobacteria bacterium]|nr:Smr/MutS family protein [Alphaproteobacteria bacterium]
MQNLLQQLSTSSNLHSYSKNLRCPLKRLALLSSLLCLAGTAPLWSSEDEKEKEAGEAASIVRSTSCFQNIEQLTEGELLREKIKALEAQENFLEAAQEMDHILESSPSAAVKDLCYALDLNQKASIQEQGRNRSLQLADQISKLLNIDPEAKCITFETASWDHIKPYLDYLIQKTVKEVPYEERTFRYKVLGATFPNYVEWQTDHLTSHKYPVAIGGRNKGSEGAKSEKGFAEIYFMELYIKNYAHKEIEARESFAYHFHGGWLDEFRVNPLTFYNLMVRAGFRKEDFEEGKYGYQDKILVKPIMLQGATLPSCFAEVKKTVSSMLTKVTHPYVTFVFELNPKASFTLNELYTYDNNNLSRWFFKEFGNLATIIEPKENRIYLCFNNDKRTTLDLHEMAYEEAFVQVVGFIEERYDNFDSECKIITGRGNHVNSNGSRGVLHKSFEKWAERPELKPLIKKYMPYGDGGYIVMLHKPQRLVLNGNSEEQHIERIIRSVLETDKAGQDRLIITHQRKQPSSYFDTLFAKSVVQLFYQHQFSSTLQPKTEENALHLTWFYEEEGDDLPTEKNEEIALSTPQAAKVTISSSSKQVTSNKQRPLNNKDSKKSRGNNRNPKQQKGVNNNFRTDIRTPEDYKAYKEAAVMGNIQACRALGRYHSARGEDKAAHKYYSKANKLKKKASTAPSPQITAPKAPLAKQKPRNAPPLTLQTPKLPSLKAPTLPAKGTTGTSTQPKSSATWTKRAIKPSTPKPAAGAKNPPVSSKPSKTSEMWRVKKAPEKT